MLLEEFAGVEPGGFGEGEEHFGWGVVSWAVADLGAVGNSD